MATTQKARNQKQTNTGGLAKLVKLRIGTKVMLPVNIVIQDNLITAKLEMLGILNLPKIVFVKYM